MPVLKHVMVDDIEDVTVVVFENLNIRHSWREERLHVSMCEAEKDKDEILVELNDEEAICMSTKMEHIDFILDFPNVKSAQRMIEILQNILKEHDNNKERTN